jgi:hypothetical protein
VEISRILSLASSGFTEEHASSSGPSEGQQFQQSSFVLHLKKQPFRAWQYVYVGIFSHTDTDYPTLVTPDISKGTRA